ncbi:hypothetical protein EYC84_005260 [Monilinia fructicola]|uniref:PLAC8-domain-containing protein n=2 Tax=Monilinia fructicola TaxID=38448 RepID=A0A5M9JVY0_MONFR|nr:hypothetical protein EYC84_005260 [Monilinia fructicola]
MTCGQLSSIFYFSSSNRFLRVLYVQTLILLPYHDSYILNMPTAYKNSFWACCTPFDLCLKACCCPCFVSGRNHHRIEHGNDDDYSTCNGWCCGWYGLAAVGGFSFVLQMLDRQKMQKQHDLEGNACTGCMGSCCCACCELMQTSKELDYILLEKNAGTKGYQPQPGMVAGPQPVAYQ